jgi:hypothetical protein
MGAFNLLNTYRRPIASILALNTPQVFNNWAIDGSNDLKVTTASHSFVTDDIGSVVTFSPGIGVISSPFNYGINFIIESVSSGAAILSASAGTPGSTGGLGQFCPLVMDITSYLTKAVVKASDQLESHTLEATFVSENLSSGQPYFEEYGTAGGSTVLVKGRFIYLRWGYTDDAGNSSLWDGFWGTIVARDWEYTRNDSAYLVQITVADLMFNFLTQKVTTLQWTNQQINLIAEDLVLQYGQIINYALYPLDYSLPLAQFPSFTVADALKCMYDTVLYFVWFNFSGALSTSPRVGSIASTVNYVTGDPGPPSIIGWPDAVIPPDSSLVSFTYPTGSLLLNQRLEDQYYKFTNQERMLGQSVTETITYGPVTLLFAQGSPGDWITLGNSGSVILQANLSPTAGGSNLLLATGVFVEVTTDQAFIGADGGWTSIQYLCSDPTAVDINNVSIPMGPIQSGNTVGGNVWNSSNPAIPDLAVFYPPGGYSYSGWIYMDIPCANDPASDYDNATTGPETYPGTTGHTYGAGKTSWTSVPINAYATGGFNFAINVYGRPIIASDAILTVFLDYNVTILTGASCLNVFSDNQTYQIYDSSGNSVQPIAMSVPLEIMVNSSDYAVPAGTLRASEGAGVTTITVNTSETMNWYAPDSSQGLIGIQLINISDGANSEYAQITQATPSAGFVELMLSQPTQFVHSSGISVYGITALLTADGLNVSPYVKADWEQGRIVFNDTTYNIYLADNARYQFSTIIEIYQGLAVNDYIGTPNTTLVLFDLDLCLNPAPEELYQSYRSGGNYDNIGVVFQASGFQIGRGYTVRLHFADPICDGSAQRVFAILINGIVVTNEYDIWLEATGNDNAVIASFDGVQCDLATVITIQCVTGSNYPNTTADGSSTHGEAIISGIEFIDPTGATTGETAIPLINCGGPLLTPPAPTVTCNTGFSANQREYGIRTETINNPLLATVEQCTNVGTWFLQYNSWKSTPSVLKFAAIPPLNPASIIEFNNPEIGSTGSTEWDYIQALTRTLEIDENGNTTFEDEFDSFLVYIEAV